MRNKKNVYKRKINFKKIFKNIGSAVFTLMIASFFCFLGYSVARPFSEIGRVESIPESSQVPLKDYVDSIENDEVNKIRAYWLKDKDCKDLESLESAVQAVPENYNTVVVPLKVKGGMLNFYSSVEGAEEAEANSENSLEEILGIIREEGLTPIASVNVMEDNLYPNAENNAGFLYEKNHELWLDASLKKGGKPWLNPASPEAKAYSSSITDEIAQSGFEYIIGTDVAYPNFSQDALDEIEKRVNDKNRYLDLIDLVNDMAEAADVKNSEMWIEISAYDLLTDNCEVYDAMLLKTANTVIKIDISEFTSKLNLLGEEVDFSKMSVEDKIKKVCEITETYIYKDSYIPEVTGKNFSAMQIKAAESTFEELGYDSYIVK